MGRWLIILGVTLVIVGIVVHFGGQFLRLGNLPGDFYFTKGRTTFYFPLATSVIISVLLTIVLNIFFRR